MKTMAETIEEILREQARRSPRVRLIDRLWAWLRSEKPDTRYPIQKGPGTPATNPHWPWWRQSDATGNNHGEGWSVDPAFQGAVTEPPGWWDSPFNPAYPHLLAAANWIARWIFRRKPLAVEPLDGSMTSIMIAPEEFALFGSVDRGAKPAASGDLPVI